MIAYPYPSLASDTLADIVRLIRTPHIGPVTFFQLIQRYGTAAAAIEALPELSRRGGRKTALVPLPYEQAVKEIESVHAFGARMIVYGSPDYPALLHMLPDAPPVITVAGHFHLWHDRDSIAIVGSRNASANGCQLAHTLAKQLGEQQMLVVSGLARGIDSYAHKGSLTTGTIAVIAGGIDNIYPPENAGLYQHIIEKGAIISEQAFGSLPYSGSFPGRNRIIAGMSLGTLVVEASPKSGSLITARFAMENNREVFAVPGSPLDPRSKGCNHLLKQGATLVEDAGDILQAVVSLRTSALTDNHRTPYQGTSIPIAQDNAPPEPVRNIVIQKLGASPVAIDILIEQCDASASTVAAILLELELAGRLRRYAGNKVALANAPESAIA